MRGPVLIVEDNNETRRALTAVLSISGYDTIEARDGAQALACLRGPTGGVSLVLLDLCMPTMDGYAFLRAKRADPDLANVPVVVYSALGPDGIPDSVPYVGKGSSTPDQLLAVIDRECSKH
jgi:CheY-like chemotaxis protein